MSTAEQQHSVVTAPAVKVISVWAAVGFTSWTDVAAFLAAVYSLLLILEWVWKKVGRRFCEMHGWLKRKQRRADDRPD